MTNDERVNLLRMIDKTTSNILQVNHVNFGNIRWRCRYCGVDLFKKKTMKIW